MQTTGDNEFVHPSMLRGRTALVTGAGRGIGFAIASMLAAAGADVVMADVDAEALEQAASDLPTEQVHAVAVDLLDEDGPDTLVRAAIARFGSVDIVVNNAGYTWDGPVHTMSDSQWSAMLDIHATVPFRVLRAAAPHLRDAAKRDAADGVERFRKVVNITSVSGTTGNAAQANYAAGKAAVIGLTKSLAKEWGPLKINVNAVAFGFVDTRLTAQRDSATTTRIGEQEVALGVPDHIRSMAEMFTPLGRVGTTAEAAGPVLFLCSQWADFVTGQVLTVNGGMPTGMS